jgi:hypothetical protein
MRPATVGRLALGVTALLQPRRVSAWWGADPDEPPVLMVARVLGARHLAQAVLLTVHPGRTADRISATVDALHGTSMVLLAGVSPRARRPALTSAGVALAFTAATVVRLRRTGGCTDQ